MLLLLELVRITHAFYLSQKAMWTWLFPAYMTYVTWRMLHVSKGLPYFVIYDSIMKSRFVHCLEIVQNTFQVYCRSIEYFRMSGCNFTHNFVMLTHTLPLKLFYTDPARKPYTLSCLVFLELIFGGIPLFDNVAPVFGTASNTDVGTIVHVYTPWIITSLLNMDSRSKRGFLAYLFTTSQTEYWTLSFREENGFTWYIVFCLLFFVIFPGGLGRG